MWLTANGYFDIDKMTQKQAIKTFGLKKLSIPDKTANTHAMRNTVTTHLEPVA